MCIVSSWSWLYISTTTTYFIHQINAHFKPSKILGLFLKSFIWHHLVKLRCLLLPDAYKLHQLHFAKFNGLNKDFIEPNRFTQGWCQTPSLVSVSMHLPALCLSMDPLRSKVSLHLSDTSDPASTDSRLLGHGEIQEEIKGADWWEQVQISSINQPRHWLAVSLPLPCWISSNHGWIRGRPKGFMLSLNLAFDQQSGGGFMKLACQTQYPYMHFTCSAITEAWRTTCVLGI